MRVWLYWGPAVMHSVALKDGGGLWLELLALYKCLFPGIELHNAYIILDGLLS